VVARFGPGGENGNPRGTGIAFYNGALYAETNGHIVRYALSAGATTPNGAPEVVVSELPLTGDHPMHPFRIDAHGGLLFQPPRLMAEGVNVDPLGSCMIGARVFPDMFRGLVAIAPDAWMVTPLGA